MASSKLDLNDLARYLTFNYKLTRNEARALVKDLFDFIYANMLLDNEVQIPGFGRFILRPVRKKKSVFMDGSVYFQSATKKPFFEFKRGIYRQIRKKFFEKGYTCGQD